jgi:MFS family permease
VRLASAAGRWVLAVAVLGEAMTLLEATVVNVALPSIGRDLGADIAGLQWTLNAYVLTLAALVLAAGSLSDIYGRRRVFILGWWSSWPRRRCARPPRRSSCWLRPGLVRGLAGPC